MVGRRGAYRGLVGRPDGKVALGRPRHRLKDNIKMNLQDVGWRGMEWIAVEKDRDRRGALGNAVINLRVP
jgi:hypothetical protein